MAIQRRLVDYIQNVQMDDILMKLFSQGALSHEEKEKIEIKQGGYAKVLHSCARNNILTHTYTVTALANAPALVNAQGCILM